MLGQTNVLNPTKNGSKTSINSRKKNSPDTKPTIRHRKKPTINPSRISGMNFKIRSTQRKTKWRKNNCKKR